MEVSVEDMSFDPHQQISMRDIDKAREAKRHADERRKSYWVGFICGMIVLFILSTVASAEERMCDNPQGCDAVANTPNGPIVIQFRHGDFLDPGQGDGWILLREKGWIPVDCSEAPVIHPSMVGL